MALPQSKSHVVLRRTDALEALQRRSLVFFGPAHGPHRNRSMAQSVPRARRGRGQIAVLQARTAPVSSPPSPLPASPLLTQPMIHHSVAL